MSSLLACSAGSDDEEDGSQPTSTSGAGGEVAAAGGSVPGDGGGGSTGAFPGGGNGGGGGEPGCLDTPAVPAGAEALLAADYEGLYTAYDLGTVPGMPAGHLGGCVVKYDDPNTLLLAGDSEAATGGIYSIQVERGPCGHIIGFVGSASLVATTEYVDANLVYGPTNVLFYTQWPTNRLSQLLPTSSSPDSTLEASTIGINAGSSVSGFGFVPPNLGSAGEPRTVTWSAGEWFRLAISGSGPTYNLSGAVQTTTIPNGPGGFAYIPAGSPGFDAQSLIVAEWSTDSVATYQVDDQGDPRVETRKDFFTTFPRPWGAYFEPSTGDFLFLTWGSLPDHVYVVQGFATPPPPPPPPE